MNKSARDWDRLSKILSPRNGRTKFSPGIPRPAYLGRSPGSWIL